ncbi:uncharacterized protein LOC118508934 [Anopheles stephensi]|uniref:uncharacterized protein LOC118508934 n=1 Tax=Anopheles stephensi TaxID=30069 RepID=UPI001658A019|nr:uncharacterized protein LOC118508934 [Anopheles stephensi]
MDCKHHPSRNGAAASSSLPANRHFYFPLSRLSSSAGCNGFSKSRSLAFSTASYRSFEPQTHIMLTFCARTLHRGYRRLWTGELYIICLGYGLFFSQEPDQPTLELIFTITDLKLIVQSRRRSNAPAILLSLCGYVNQQCSRAWCTGNISLLKITTLRSPLPWIAHHPNVRVHGCVSDAVSR